MEGISQELNQLKQDIFEIQEKCRLAYDEVKKELKHKEIALEKLYEHNLQLVKERHDCENK
jgi:hypothetical protein